MLELGWKAGSELYSRVGKRNVTQFIDSTVILGFVTKDNHKRTENCLTLLEKVQRGEVPLETSGPVISKVVAQLSSHEGYNLGRDQVRTLLVPLIRLPFFHLPHKKTFLRALDLFVALPIEFEDAVSAAEMERDGIKEIYSYDLDFDRFEFIRRIEP